MADVVGSTRITLNNGKTMPVLGLGTWKSKPGEVRAAVETAIDAGYQHIDGAFAYLNEKEVGEALKKKMSEGIKREDLFITSKLWNTKHEPADVRPALERTLKDLQLDYVDLYLIHWPVSLKAGDDLFPTDSDGNWIVTNAHYKETWPEMEKLVDAGLTKSIGLSNFNSKQIDEVVEISRIKPAVLQAESHPYLIQTELINHCKKHGITFTAYSPLGSPDRPWATPDEPNLLEDPKLKAIAQNYNKSPAQVCIRYQIQRGIVVLPKSVTASRIKANAEVFDFTLSEEDVKTIESFNRNWRVCEFKLSIFKTVDGKQVDTGKTLDYPLHPFNIPY